MKSGREYLTLSSGYIEQYRDFMPKYALYEQHIKDAIEWVISELIFMVLLAILIKIVNIMAYMNLRKDLMVV